MYHKSTVGGASTNLLSSTFYKGGSYFIFLLSFFLIFLWALWMLARFFRAILLFSRFLEQEAINSRTLYFHEGIFYTRLRFFFYSKMLPINAATSILFLFYLVSVGYARAISIFTPLLSRKALEVEALNSAGESATNFLRCLSKEASRALRPGLRFYKLILTYFTLIRASSLSHLLLIWCSLFFFTCCYLFFFFFIIYFCLGLVADFGSDYSTLVRDVEY